MTKAEIHKELHLLFGDGEQDNIKIIDSDIIDQLCDFFDSNVLTSFVEHCKEEKGWTDEEDEEDED